MSHIIDAEGIRSWIDDDDGRLYASDGSKRLYVHLKLYGDPRFVVKFNDAPLYDGYDIEDAVQSYNNTPSN